MESNGVPSPWHDQLTRFQTSPPPQYPTYQPQVHHRLASMTYAANMPFEQPYNLAPPIIYPKFEDEAFELAFAEAENAAQLPAATVEPETPEVMRINDADRLAQTAGELFDSLQHQKETDEKFRNSKFMELMKKLRDREIVVARHDMVQASSLTESEMAQLNGADESASI